MSSAYKEAIKAAIIVQIISTTLLLLILDGGRLAHFGGLVMMGFWIGAILIMSLRPLNPTHFDLIYIRWGYPPLFILIAVFWSIIG